MVLDNDITNPEGGKVLPFRLSEQHCPVGLCRVCRHSVSKDTDVEKEEMNSRNSSISLHYDKDSCTDTVMLLGLLVSQSLAFPLLLSQTIYLWRKVNLVAVSPRVSGHLSSSWVQSMGGTGKKRVGDTETFFSLLYRLRWYLQ